MSVKCGAMANVVIFLDFYLPVFIEVLGLDISNKIIIIPVFIILILAEIIVAQYKLIEMFGKNQTG